MPRIWKYLLAFSFCLSTSAFLMAGTTYSNQTPPQNTPYQPDPWEDDGEIASGPAKKTSGTNAANTPYQPDPWEDEGE